MTEESASPATTTTTTSEPQLTPNPTSASTGAPAPAPSPAPAPAPAPAPGPTSYLPAPFRPDKPRLGGLEQFDHGKFNPFTGLNGQPPNSGRTARADGIQPDLVYANQLRPLGSSSQKSQAYRQLYDGTPITRKVKITKWKKEFFQRGVQYGYDTIFYLEDSNGDQVNIIVDSDKFDMESAKQAYEDVQLMYDKYDTANDHDATTYLLNLLDPDLKADVELFHDSTSGFVVVWYAVLAQLYNSNIDRKRDLESKIRSISVTQYAQQDISKVVAKFLLLCDELDDMDSYNHDNTVKILDCMSHTGGGADPNDPDTLDWRRDVLELRKDMKREMNKIRRLSLADQDTYLKSRGLHFRSVLQTMHDNYKMALHNKAWPPSKNQVDRNTPRLNLMEGKLATNANEAQMFEVFKVFMLQQQEYKRNGGKKKPDDNDKQGPKDPPTKNPKKIPPGPKHRPTETKDNVNHYTKTINDKLVHWCQTCGRWTPSHWSWEHGKQKPSEGGKQAHNLVEFDYDDFDFSDLEVFMMNLPVVETVADDDVPDEVPLPFDEPPTVMFPQADCSGDMDADEESIPDEFFDTVPFFDDDDFEDVPCIDAVEISLAPLVLSPAPSVLSRLWSCVPSWRSTVQTTVVGPIITALNLLSLLVLGLVSYDVLQAVRLLCPLLAPHLTSGYSIAPWTWFGCLLLLVIGPARLFGPPQPYPRQL